MAPYVIESFAVVLVLNVNIEIALLHHPQVEDHRPIHGCIIYIVRVLINIRIFVLVFVIWGYIELTENRKDLTLRGEELLLEVKPVPLKVVYFALHIEVVLFPHY